MFGEQTRTHARQCVCMRSDLNGNATTFSVYTGSSFKRVSGQNVFGPEKNLRRYVPDRRGGGGGTRSIRADVNVYNTRAYVFETIIILVFSPDFRDEYGSVIDFKGAPPN